MSTDRIDENQPAGEGIKDDEYQSRTGQSHIPVVKDDDVDADDKHMGEIDPQADSDQQLEKDDNEAIDKSNIMDSRTRGATKQSGTYAEPGDEEGLPSDTGKSSN